MSAYLAGVSPSAIADSAELRIAAIRDGHRRLLREYREATASLMTPGGIPEPADVRAVIWLLRESLLTFATWEEDCLSPGTLLAEDTAFEHAFLRAETDALAETAAAHFGPGAPDLTWVQRVRRHFDRIEALLELHVLKAEDRDDGGVALLEAPQPIAVLEPAASEFPRPRGPRTLEREEIDAFLRRHDWGILATVGDELPYAVPVTYGWDGQAVYLACAPGQKARYLEAEPVACLTVADVEDTDHWRSVVARGRVRWITRTSDRLEALRVLHRQRGQAMPSLQDLARLTVARFARLDPTELTGRARG